MVLLLCLMLAMLAFFHILSLPKEFLIFIAVNKWSIFVLLNFLYLIFNFIDFFFCSIFCLLWV